MACQCCSTNNKHRIFVCKFKENDRIRIFKLKLNGTHHLLVYGDDNNILRGSIHTIKKNTESLIMASEEIGLEINADKTKYVIMSRDQSAGRSHNMQIDN